MDAEQEKKNAKMTDLTILEEATLNVGEQGHAAVCKEYYRLLHRDSKHEHKKHPKAEE